MLVIHSDLLFFFCTQVLIIDPSNENVILVAEELHIRLASSSASHLDGKDNLSGQHDGKGAEEDCKLVALLSNYRCQKHGLLFFRFLFICNIPQSLIYHMCSWVVRQFSFEIQ